jgi:hypothetical protein
MKTVIEMARKSKLDIYGLGCPHDKFIEAVERFAELVRADEREKYKWDVHSCGPTCTKAACVAMREAVETEREACAKVCESEWSNVAERMYGEECAAAIRARSNT